jgi:hypothetical protein
MMCEYRAKGTAGPSTTLRSGASTSGRDDDNSMAGQVFLAEAVASQQNCHPDRSSGGA